MKVDARKCENDSCGAVVLAEEAVTVRTTFRGARKGSYIRELCGPCADNDVPEGVEVVLPKGSESDEETPKTL
jgi:hypothetical protein